MVEPETSSNILQFRLDHIVHLRIASVRLGFLIISYLLTIFALFFFNILNNGYINDNPLMF